MNKALNIYFLFAIVATLFLNIFIGTSGLVLWISAFASIFNLYLTSKGNKWFIIPDLIWCICMFGIAFFNWVPYDLFTYTFYIIIAFVQFNDWKKGEQQGETKFLKIPKDKIIKILIVLLVLICGFGLFEYTFLGNPIVKSLLDACNTSLAFTGAYLLAKRYYQAYYLFIISNTTSMILYLITGVPSVAITMLLFIGFSLIGFVNLRQKI